MPNNQLHTWKINELIKADLLNEMSQQIASNADALDAKFKINEDHNIENVPNYVSNIEKKLRADFSSDLNQVNSTLSENFLNILNSINKIEFDAGNERIDLENKEVPQETTVIAEANTLVKALNDYRISLESKINEKFNEIDNTLNHYLDKIELSISSFPFYDIGDILITTKDYSTPNNYEEETFRIIGNSLTDLDKEIYWIPYGQGRTLIGAGTGTDDQPTPESIDFEGGSTGGEYNHSLTIEEMPPHTHNIYYLNKTNPKRNVFNVGLKNSAYGTLPSSSTGGNGAENTIPHNNLPPYIVVYFYKRVDAQEYQTFYNLDENFNLIIENGMLEEEPS